MKLRFALPVVLALLSSAAFAQTTTTVNIVLDVPTVGVNCGDITQETINGDIYPTGTLGQVCVHYNNGTIPLFFNLSAQPWAPGLGFYQIIPPANQIVVGPKVQVSGNIYSETDSFMEVINYYDFGYHTDTWVGQIVRLQKQLERCGRWLCNIPPDECTPANRCVFEYTDLSNSTQMTGTLVVQ